MVNKCVVQCWVVGTPKQNVTMHEFPKERASRSLWWRFVQTTRSHSVPTHHSYVSSQHFISLDFVNDVESQKGYAKKRVINKTAVPAIFPSKLSDSQRSVKKVGGLGGNVPVVCGFCDRSFFFSTLFHNVYGVAGSSCVVWF